MALIPISTCEKFNEHIQELIFNLSVKYSEDYEADLEQEDADAQENLFVSNEGSIRRRKQFIDRVYHSHEFTNMKENLLKIVKKLVQHKFEMTTSVSGVKRDADDQFYSALYQYLIEQARSSFKDMIQKKTDEFHQEIMPTPSKRFPFSKIKVTLQLKMSYS